MFLLKSIVIFMCIALKSFSLDKKELKLSYMDFIQSPKYLQYKEIQNKYDVCWNGADSDLLNSEEDDEETILSIQEYFEKQKNPTVFNAENKYKKFITNLFFSKLFSRNQNKTYSSTAEYEEILETTARVLAIKTRAEQAKKCSDELMLMYLLPAIDCFLLTRDDVFLNIFLKQEKIQLSLQENQMIHEILKEDSTEFWENFIDSHASEKISSFDMMQFLRGSLKKIIELIQDESESFEDFTQKYRLRYEILKNYFPDLFLNILKDRDGGFFAFLRAGNLKNHFKLSMDPLKKEAVHAPLLKLHAKDEKTGFLKEQVHESFLPEQWEKLNKEFFNDFFLLSHYFEPIMKDMIMYPPVLLGPSSFICTDKRKALKEKASEAKMESDAQRCRVLLKRYYFFRQSSLINIASNGAEKFSSEIKIRENRKIIQANRFESKIKEIMKNLYKDDFLLHQIFKGDLGEDKAKRIFKDFKECDLGALERLEEKYAYRDFLMNQYYAENIAKKEQLLLTQIETCIEEKKRLEIEKAQEQEKLALERDRLFKELIDEEEKGKKSGKKKNQNNAPSKSNSKSKKKKTASAPVKKDVKKEVVHPSASGSQKKPELPSSSSKKENVSKKKSAAAVQQKKSGKQNQKKTDNKSVKTVVQNSPVLEKKITILQNENRKKIHLKEECEKKPEDILDNQNSEEYSLVQRNIDELQDQIMHWEKNNVFLQEEIDKKESYYNQILIENKNIKNDIRRLINYLKEVQKSKASQKERVNKELENIEEAIKNSDVEKLAAQDVYFLKQQVQLILENSYSEFYSGIQSMNEMIARKFQLSQEVYFLAQENKRLATEISLKEILLKKPEEKKLNNNNQGILSKVKEKVKIAKKTVSLMKDQDFRKINLKDLNLHLGALLTREHGLKSLNQKLQHQLEYTDRKLPAVLEKREELQKRLFSIQKRYNAVIQGFNKTEENDAVKMRKFYKEEMVRRIPSSKLMLDFVYSIADFYDSNEYAMNLVGQLRLDMEGIMSELRHLNSQVMILTEKNAHLLQIQEKLQNKNA